MKKFASHFFAILLAMMVCNVEAQTIFFENFNSDSTDSALPEGWTVYDDTLTNYPLYAGYNQGWQVWYPEGTSRSGEAMSVTFTTDTWEPCNRWLITPLITLPADSVMSLLFRHRCSGFGQFSVRISTTGTDTADFTTEIGWITVQPEKNYESISLEDYVGESVYIAFVNNVVHNNGSCAQFIALDDVEVTHLPKNSIALADVIMPEQAVVGQPFAAKLKLFNTGRNFVQSINYSYRINGGAPVTNTVNIGYWCWRISEVNISIIPTELGEATIEFQVSMPNGVADYDSTDNVVVRTLGIIDEPPVGIASMEQDVQVMVYPNPTHGKVTVKSHEPLVSAVIADMAGRREGLRLNANDNGGYGFDLTSFPQGAYFLVLTTITGQHHTVKLVKQ